MTTHEKPEPPTSPPIFAMIAGQPREAHPAAVLWFFEHHPRAEDGPAYTVQRAARLAAAERMVYDRSNGFWWEWVAAEGFPGAVRCRLYELDMYRGESPIYYDREPVLERLVVAWLALDSLDPTSDPLL
jgi:hypothetical protein